MFKFRAAAWHTFLAVIAAGLASCAAPAIMPSLPQQPTSIANPASGASGGSLLFISEYRAGRVDVLSYPNALPIATLKGFRGPNGVCGDGNGHVWITDTLAQRIVEFRAGTAQRLATLNDPDEYPVDCAVDPVSGDVAVTDLYGSNNPSLGAGNVVVYRSGRGKPRGPYYDSVMSTVNFCTYDDKGNLFFDGASYGGGFRLAELRSGSASIENLTLNQAIEEPGDIERDGSDLALGDQQAHTVYEISVSGSQATVVGSTMLARAGEIEQFALSNGSIIAAQGYANRAATWNFPQGGAPTATISHLKTPMGLAIVKSDAGAHQRSIAAFHKKAPRRNTSQLRSWMATTASSSDLLYIADSYNSVVDVYSYPQGTLVGTLTGFNLPQGECSDARGDVFITNTNSSQILEFRHGATQPIATLDDPYENPVGCAVDSKTGTLAVTNLTANGYGGSGSVALYAHARGTPKLFFDPDIYFMFFCGYDNRGNLFVDGQHFGGGGKGFQLAELTPHSNIFRNIVVPMLVDFPGGVQWDGRNVAVGDQAANVIYRLRINGLTSDLEGTTPLDGGLDVVQFWQERNVVIGPDALAGNAGFWKYPAGGSEFKSITGLGGPEGATVSIAPAKRLAQLVRSKCGMSPAFLSDYNNGLVDIYDGAALCKVVYRFSNPNGIVVDDKGNLYVTERGKSDIAILKPPYRSVAQRLEDPGADPSAVALCKGYIAVTNLSSGSGTGSVAIFTGSASTPSYVLQDTNAVAEYSPACDPSGNLFTSYRNQSGTGGVNEWLTAKGSPLELSAISMGFPGGLQYERGALWVGDQGTPQITLWSPPFAHSTETISLRGSDDPVDFVVDRSRRQIDVADAALNEGIIFTLHGREVETLPGNGGGLAVGIARRDLAVH